MGNNTIKRKGYDKSVDPGVGKANVQTVPLLGIVKNNIDSNKTGRIWVYLLDNLGLDENDHNNWRSVQYMTPFFGATAPNGQETGFGEYKLNPSSYGMWYSPPDIGSTVVCIFINGDMSPQTSFYIGAVPNPVALRMVPAIGANFDNEDLIFNEGEAESLGGAIRVPVTNMNTNDSGAADSEGYIDSPKPCHSYSSAIMFQQGILRDPIRGPVSSSAQRESPSRVGWGVSTPGRPIYEGGYTDETLPSALRSGNENGLKVISRRGGHSIVMDDGDITGRDRLMRLRTAQGHQILMSDDGQVLMILHSNGQSYIELGKEGTVDIYSTNSVNIRTQGDLNLHADNNVNIHAKKEFKVQAESIQISSDTNYNLKVGADYQAAAMGKHTTKANGPIAMAAAGEASLVSGAITYINGSKVNLNTGKPSTTPADVPAITKILHTDTLQHPEKGFIASPGSLPSITSRAPAHAPWAHANQGVSIKTNLSASATLPPAPSASVTQTNNVASAPPVSVSQGIINAMPNTVAPVSQALNRSATSAMLGAAATMTAAEAPNAVRTGSEIVTGADGEQEVLIGQYGQTAEQMETGGILKTGAAKLVKSLVQGGMSIERAMSDNLFTGVSGAGNFDQFVRNVEVQSACMVNNFQVAQAELTVSGLISGREDPTQIAGMVMATANEGLSATLDAVTTVGGLDIGLSADISRGGAGLSFDINKNFNVGGVNVNLGAGGDITSGGGFNIGVGGDFLAGGSSGGGRGSLGGVLGWVSTGNFAAGLSGLNSKFGSLSLSVEKMSGSLSLNAIIAKTRGAAAGAFYAIAGSFSAFKARVPQNLKQIARQSAQTTTDQSLSVVGGYADVDIIGKSLNADLGITLGNDNTQLDLGVSLVDGKVQFDAGIEGLLKGGAGVFGGSISTGSFGESVDLSLDTRNLSVDLFAEKTNLINRPISAVNSYLSGVLDTDQRVVSSLSNPASSIASGIDKLPGGQGAIAQVTNFDAFKQSIPGTDNLKSLMDKAQTAVMNNLPDPADLLNSNKESLTALASTGLPAGAASELQSAISSIGEDGEVSLPKIGVNTNDRSLINEQIDSILGDPGIPKPNFSGIPPESFEMPPSGDQYEAKVKQLLDADLEYKKYLSSTLTAAEQSRDALEKTLPPGDPKLAEAEKRVQDATAEADKLKQKKLAVLKELDSIYGSLPSSKKSKVSEGPASLRWAYG